MRSFLKNNSAIILLTVASVVAVVRFSWFLQIHSVNLLYTDQWTLYEIFLRHPNLWELFTFQYGPHRQGIGYIITWLVAVLSGWNVRVEILTLILTHIGTFFLLLALKHRLFNRWQISDLIIPVVLFSLKYFEAFVIVPNISHGVLPIFLISLMALIWTSTAKQKYFAFACIGILTIFTGFGIVVLPAIFLLLFSEFVSPSVDAGAKKNILVAGILALVGTLSYFYGYTYNPAVSCSVNPFIDWIRYPEFIGKLTTNFFGFAGFYSPALGSVGLGIFVTVVFIFAKKIIELFSRTARDQQTTQIQLLFLETTVVFVLLCAVGRTCVGNDIAASSRYLLYFIPAAIAGYFILLQQKSSRLKILVIGVFIGVLLIGEIINMPNIIRKTLDNQQGKYSWLGCYRENKSVLYCNKRVNFEILPPYLYHMAEDMLIYTKEHNLHIYRDQ